MNFLKKIATDFKDNYKTLILAFVIAAALWIVVSINVFPTIENEIGNIAVTAQPTEDRGRKWISRRYAPAERTLSP